MILRRFNELGIGLFEGFLDRMQEEAGEAAPRLLLNDDKYTEQIFPCVRLDAGPFLNHFEISRHLHERFN